MATRFSNIVHAAEDRGQDLADHIAALRHEVAALAEMASRYGGRRFEEVQEQLPVVARQVSRQARAAGNAVRSDPLPAVMVVGTLFLLSRLLRRR